MIQFSRRVNRAFFVVIRDLRSDGDDSGDRENLPLPAFDPEVAAEMSFPLLLLAAGCGGCGGGGCGGCGGCRGLNM